MTRREQEWLIRDKYDGRLPDRAVLALDMARLKKGEPLDYIIGWREFLGCRIDLSSHPLIPREETEYWVEKAIVELEKDKNKITKCLDIFAGSGCIGLAILKHVPNAKVDFAEKDKKIIDQIKLNLQINKIDKKRIRIIQSDIFSNIKGKYDYIFANPPYIPASRKLAKSVAGWEPKAALFSGEDGLTLIKKFLKQARCHLNEGGKIFLEFDSTQKKKIEEMIKRQGWLNYSFERDQSGRWRTLILF